MLCICSDLGAKNDKLLFRLTVWLYSFIIKFVPSIVLTVFTGFLIQALYKAEERSARLKNGNPSKNGGNFLIQFSITTLPLLGIDRRPGFDNWVSLLVWLY